MSKCAFDNERLLDCTKECAALIWYRGEWNCARCRNIISTDEPPMVGPVGRRFFLGADE